MEKYDIMRRFCVCVCSRLEYANRSLGLDDDVIDCKQPEKILWSIKKSMYSGIFVLALGNTDGASRGN